MLKYIPFLFVVCSCQVFGIKNTDTIRQAEEKVLDKIEEKVGIASETEGKPPTSVPQE